MKRYCLDTSALINGWHKHYNNRVFPGVWESLEMLFAKGRAFSCLEVLKELSQQRDTLYEWAYKRSQRFEPPNEETLTELRNVMAEFPNLVAQGGAKNTADPWVIAHAKADGGIVVSDENSVANRRPNKPPKIPDVCSAFGIRCIKLSDLLEDHEITLVRHKKE